MLSTVLESALFSLGITPESVSRLLGRDCGCRERKERLDALELWARRVISGKIGSASLYLSALLGDGGAELAEGREFSGGAPRGGRTDERGNLPP